MAKCIYFFDKVTQKIVGMHSHAIKDPKHPAGMKEADADITSNWEDIRTGKLWPFLLEKITDKNPDNFGFIQAEEIPRGYNEYEPEMISETVQLKRRPYFCLKIKSHPKLLKSTEHDVCCLYEINTEGDVTLEMEVCVKHMQGSVENHADDKDVTGINGNFIAEVNYGRLLPRDGKIEMKDSKASFQWYLPDSTTHQPVKCFVKDPENKILISKSLRVLCK